MSPSLEIIILASLVALTCALPGVFLVLRRISLMSDAISHAILLGIVVMFFITKDLSSPLLLIGATITGVLTVTVTEMLIRTQKVKKDTAIGLVFPFLFSIGVILLNKYASGIHLDADCILFGEIAFAPFDRFIFQNVDLGPIGLWLMSVVFLLNLTFIIVFYKELKLATFDPALAAALGFTPILLHYALMSLVSITAVGAFENVGSILVVALFIAPPATAYLLTNRLSVMLILSGAIGIIAAISGYWLAHFLDANIAGSMATMCGVIFFIVFIFAPEHGWLARQFFRRFKQWDFAKDILTVHLLQTELNHADQTEQIVSHMTDHMLWDHPFTIDVISRCLQDGLIVQEGEKLILTNYGREKAKISILKG
ncbi:MAG: metal ABC transporter permease [Candidatus Omnitrophica bacterium]|nr:metal ABC transporter permease [Candidatus Omnitrophota bacterium]